MITFGLIFMWVFVAIAFAILNRGPMDGHSDRSQAYWARFKAKPDQ